MAKSTMGIKNQKVMKKNIAISIQLKKAVEHIIQQRTTFT